MIPGKIRYSLFLIFFFLTLFLQAQQENNKVKLIILGTIQDAGSPHIGCKKDCCSDLFKNPDPSRKVVSLGLVNTEKQSFYLFEASPDISTQLKELSKFASFEHPETPDAIFITHAHIGHYSGLMYLGREALGARNVRVYTLPKMKSFLENNGPWDQLVKLGNIKLTDMIANTQINVDEDVRVEAFLVPHRDEYSETAGFRISGPEKTVLFIPDIDKWQKWGKSLFDELKNIDLAFIDGTFYSPAEISNRNIDEIPHPTIQESMELLAGLPLSERKKVWFIHFNHTNPALNSKEIQQEIIEKGFNIAKFGEVFEL